VAGGVLGTRINKLKSRVGVPTRRRFAVRGVAEERQIYLRTSVRERHVFYPKSASPLEPKPRIASTISRTDVQACSATASNRFTADNQTTTN
jgi:hypothetical protein